MASSVSADEAWFPALLLGGHQFNQPAAIAATLVALVLVPVIASYFFGSKSSKLPVVNAPGLFEPSIRKQWEFVRDGRQILSDARRRFPNQPFVVLNQYGRVIVLPSDRALDIKNAAPTLDFRKVLTGNFPLDPPGFGVMKLIDHPNEVLQKVVKKHLTKRLNTVTEPLARETTFALEKILEGPSDWTEIKIVDAVVGLVARLSSRVFLGPAVCRDETWLDITSTFPVQLIRLNRWLRVFPYWIRPLFYVIHPGCALLKREQRRATKIVEAEIAKRRKEKHDCNAQGVPPPVYNDAIEWAQMEAEGEPFDPTEFQLMLSSAAIITTSDLLVQTLLYLAADPEAVEALRREMVEVLPVGGWRKTSLYELKLLDSAVKEAQRFKPTSLDGLRRVATADVELPGGLKVSKGQVVVLDTSNRMDPKLYENPEKFDIYRFYNMRQLEGGEHKTQLVSVIPEHVPFGLGKYACPGRFFAANEIKLALCHLLIKYDWKLGPGATVEPVYFGTDAITNPDNKLLYRQRNPEIDLDSLEVETAGGE